MTDTKPPADRAQALPRPTFEPTDPEAWRARVERELKGADFDRALRTKLAGGLALEPVYFERPGNDLGVPGAAPFVRGTRSGSDAGHGAPWVILSRTAGPAPRVENAALRGDLAGGASGLWIEVDAGEAAGLEGADDGVVLGRRDDLSTLLDGVLLDAVQLELDPGPAFLPVAAATIDIAAAQGVDDGALRVHFGADPLGALARDGALRSSLEVAYDQLAELVRFSAEYLPQSRAITIDVSVYHRAGAPPALELGAAIATAATYLRELEQRGIAPAVAAAEIAFAVELDREQFVAIAQLRALRWLWARLAEGCGLDPVPAPWIRAATSARALSQRDPWTNVLRATSSTFAAVCGGADAIYAACFDEVLGEPGELGRRVARNSQLILAEECGLGRVADPAGGAFFVEQLTAQLAEAGWGEAQRLDGRLADWLIEGEAAAELDGHWSHLARGIATRRRSLTGVSEYPQADEPSVEGGESALATATPAAGAAAVQLDSGADLARVRQALADGGLFVDVLVALAAGSEPTLAPPLVARREAEAFEELRDATEELSAAGRPAAVWIATLGPQAEHRARSGWVANLYAAGGLATTTAALAGDDDGLRQQLDAVRPSVVCLAGTDERYADELEAALARLAAVGVDRLVVAGKPGERESALRAAGATDFIHVGIDVVAHLRSTLEHAGAEIQEVEA